MGFCFFIDLPQCIAFIQNEAQYTRFISYGDMMRDRDVLVLKLDGNDNGLISWKPSENQCARPNFTASHTTTFSHIKASNSAKYAKKKCSNGLDRIRIINFCSRNT